MRNPRMLGPNDDPALRPHPSPERSFAETMGEIVDEARQLQTELGLRPYRVFSVLVRWSGGSPGRGEPCVVMEREILPTPLLRLDGARGSMRSGGVAERGNVRLAEISTRYTEDELRALFHGEHSLPNESAFIEIRMDARDGVVTRRRFVVAGAPFRDLDKWEWTVPLVEQTPNRTRGGELRVRRP